jgi:predicted esterase
MGEVHRARHVKLRRDVAIKVLPARLAGDPSLLARFEREARTASALNHPNIVTIHDIAEQDGITYIAMELVEGRTLREMIAEGPLAVEEATEYAIQIAGGLAKAHAAGIVHRDLKPANLMVTPDRLVKILDFGLAKPLERRASEGDDRTLSSATQEGIVVGTPHYMSPEQYAGGPVDHRCDQWALGVVLYEMLGGRPPFEGPSTNAIFGAVLLSRPPSLRQVRPGVPGELERIVCRCLEKDPRNRFPSTDALAAALRRYRGRRTGPARRAAAFLRRPAGAAALAGVLLAGGGAAWVWARGAEGRWAQREAPGEINRLIERGELYPAWWTALRAQRLRPGDPEIRRLFERISLPVAVNSEPAGAEVFVKDYGTPEATWERLGVTPMRERIPYAMMRWRISKAGFEPYEGAPFSSDAIGALIKGIRLDPPGSRPPGTVWVPGGVIALPGPRLPDELPAVPLGEFFLDRYEVTNREYRAFVDAGGHTREEWWPQPIRHEGKTVSLSEAMRLFVDATGRPGPSTWEAGGYSAAEADHPVGGISWYEAAAYCAYAGKTLPTVYHWFHAVGQDQFSDILLHSNVGGKAKASVGRFRGLSAYGNYDMAGNVKEWAWNATAEGRYILGGAWNEPGYLFKNLNAQPSMSREPTNGVRCAKYAEPPAAALQAPFTPAQEYTRPPPLSDEAFMVLRGIFAYDPTPLEHRVERTSDSLPHYRRETVSFRTAYGDGRMEAHLLLPLQGRPPYQAVIWFPGSDAFLLQSSESFASTYLFDFLPRAGRAVVYPVYDGMYERFDPPDGTPGAVRDQMIRWTKDISRTIDYLATRADIDAGKLAFYGFSLGAMDGPLFTAVEPRFAAGILLGGGLAPRPFRPEVDPARYAPRVRTPTLMINGRDDFLMPYALSQKPLFDLLGPPAERKRMARLDGGHIPRDRLEIVREVLDWLDGWLGPVPPSP